MHSLDRLFKPKSIAVVGASTNEDKVGFQILYSLRKFPGPLFPINPKADKILGLQVYPSLKQIGDPVDLIILSIPAKACLNVVKEAAQIGAGAIMIASGGFGETGSAGKSLQDEILAVCKEQGVRLLGPNTAGFGVPGRGVTANLNPWIDRLSPGSVAVVSQSGSMNLILASTICDRRLGISLGVGVGNAADVGIPEIIEYLADDEDTKAIALYLEGVADGRRLYEAIFRTTIEKPIVVFTVGKSDVGEFAASHTGSLIGSYDLKINALRQAGAVVVQSTSILVAAAKMLSLVRLNPNPDPGVGLLTGQAGPALILTDFLRSNGVNMPQLLPATVDKLAALLPPISYIKNPVDTTRPDRELFSKSLSIVAEDPGIDVIVTFAIHEPAAVDPVAAHRYLKYRIDKPMIFGTSGFVDHLRPTLQDFESLEIPAFLSPDRTARAVWALVEDAKISYRKSQPGEAVKQIPETGLINPAPDESQAKELLKQIGVPVPASVVCTTHKEASAAFARLNEPCVVKVLSSDITHKTEVGGVILNIKTEDQLLTALKQIDAIDVQAQKNYIVEEMAPSGLEIIIGGKNDPSFGPTVLLGLGGTAAEAFGDVAIRLAPVTKADAGEMIAELKTSALFDGWRGGPQYDKNAVAEIVVKIGQLMAQHTEILEMDLNPVRVYEKGLMVLDALIVTGDQALRARAKIT